MKVSALIFLLIFASIASAQKTETARKTVVWKIDNLKKIGKNPVQIIGNPQIIQTEKGRAILFDGTDDGIVVDNNPIANWREFTVEAVFRPDAGGAREQRWFHIEDSENSESRALLETRLVGSEWFVDTFIKSGENRLPLLAENFKHPLGVWYAVALVFDGAEMRHYVNGKLEMSGALTIKSFGRGKTSIGVRMNKIYWFKGAILKARFTNRALSPKELLK